MKANELINKREELIQMREEKEEPSPGYADDRIQKLDKAIEQLLMYPEANEYRWQYVNARGKKQWN